MPPSPTARSRAEQSCAIADEELPPDAMPSMHFPLPSGYFGDVQVSASRRQQYSEIVRRRVNSMLADEHRYAERRAQQQPVMPQTDWKFFRRLGGLKVYQRRLRGRSRQEVAAEEDFLEAAVAVERGNPSMLAEGVVSGSIENMLYGLSATTQEEMLTGLAFTAPPQDAVLLSVVERSTAEDPLRSAEILWVLTKLPILNPRDVCYLKATGVGQDGKGRSYGYLVLHSVDLQECPPFDYRKTKILRSKMYFSFLFREITPGYVAVMGRGIFDLAGGELLKLVLPHATSSVIDGLLRGVSCGEAKKLTLLALRSPDGRRQPKLLSKQHTVCSACIRRKKGMLPGVRLRPCDACGVPICINCKVKDKRMFLGIRQPCRKVACCPTCVQQASCITGLRLGEPEFVVVAEFYSKNRPTSASSSSSHSAAAATLSTPSAIPSSRHLEQEDDDVMARNNETWKSEPMSLLSDASKVCSSVGVTNSTVDDSFGGLDSYSGRLSDLTSGPYRLSADDLEEEEPEPGLAVSAELLKEYAELGTPSPGLTTWGGSYRGHPDDFIKPAAKPRPTNMLEWMRELQSSAEEAYSTAMANEEIMKRSMRPVGVPLSPGCFQPSRVQHQQFSELVRQRVDSLLHDEARYAQRRAQHQPFLHAGEWKQVKSEKGLTFFRRLRRGRSLRELAQEEDVPEARRAVERGYTSMVCDGHVDGSIEDMMLGMTAASQHDLLTGFSFRDPPRDCVWLGTVESATREDPFHTADLIWALPKLPPIVDQVDVCYLKATGVERDQLSNRYGYLVLHSVHVAQCPAFAAHGISRAKMFFACLFREPSPGVLKVTVRGIFDLSKKVRMLTKLVTAATTSIMTGLVNGVGIGRAKKLTLLARRYQSRRAQRSLVNSPRPSTCYMCSRRDSFLGRRTHIGMHLLTCAVCGATVCSSCTRTSKQRMFIGDRPCSRVDCCPNCVREAQSMTGMRPAEPEFQVIADYYLDQQTMALPQTFSTSSESPTRNGALKTNTSTGIPTTSTTTTDESLGEYQLDFEDDPFSVALNLPELRRSSGEEVDNVDTLTTSNNNEPTSSPEAEAGSFPSEIVVRESDHRLSDDDFIPSTAIDRLQSDRLYANARLAESIEQRLLELNIQAEYTPSPSESWAEDELRLHAVEGSSPIRKFPISPGGVNLTSAQRQHYADIVRGRVDTLLAEEQCWMERRDQLLPPLDPSEWKQVKMSKQLRFFKRVRGGRTLQQLASEEALPDVRQAVVNGYSSMMCDGKVWGAMEDMMFGMTASSQQDLMTGFWYKNPPHDCVWLGSAEGATDEDPFRSADFIWALPKIAFNVDICYLKATGVERDQDGKRHGYLVLHSVELTQCRPFEARKISRAKMYFTCLFRETTPGYLDVTVRGIFDLGKNRGKITKKLVTAATKSFMGGLLNGVGIGLAKKLTLMFGDMAQPGPSRSPETSDSEVTTIMPWTGTYMLDDDDFVCPPVYEQIPVNARREAMQQPLFQLNVTAENTYIQTQATMRWLRGEDLD
ncbi:unnamed protein product [Phytophthora fragariaefolia]|uniref:Unnamed protein product n=1 Tax=Phytophthora fragariaefolia TaxID=1490495 RepID=A0A9W7D4J7_9STRA|nr:unnamed protein product [Phytophthora fragariaefolia]